MTRGWVRTWNRGDLEEGYVAEGRGWHGPGRVKWQEIRLDGAGGLVAQDILAVWRSVAFTSKSQRSPEQVEAKKSCDQSWVLGEWMELVWTMCWRKPAVQSGCCWRPPSERWGGLSEARAGVIHSAKSNHHRALLDQVRQGAALKELSRAIYEDRLGDNLSEGMREREEVKDPSIPVSGIWGGG